MAVSKRLRYEILRRDDHACRYCGDRAPDVKLTVDHVIPVALGGTDVPENLVTACAACNAGKSSSSPDAPIVANVANDALRWARAMEMASALHQAKQEAVASYIDGFGEHWEDHFAPHAAEYDYYRPHNWRESVERFHAAGIASELADIVTSVMGRQNISNDRIWRYFCGYCWRVIRERQDMARSLIDSGEIE